MAVPDPIIYKIIRAQEHLQALESDMGQYFKENPAKVVRQHEGSPDEYIGRVVAGRAIPMRLQLILGDFLQNLRSSLDYLVWELVLAAKNTPGVSNMFPICSTLDKFKDAAFGRKRLNGVPDIAKTVIECLQPYNRGDFEKSVLWVLDDLCNINKHRRVPLTRWSGGIAPDGTETKTIDGQSFIHTDLAAIADNTKIGPFPMIDGRVKMPMNLNIVAFIAFDEGPAKGMEITTVMRGMLEYIHLSVLPLFNEFFV
jgi:hypothetical protein